FARLPNVSITAAAGDLPKLDHEWYVNGKLVSRSANPNMGDFELVNGDTLVYRVWGNTNCDGRISASDTMIEVMPAGYDPIFVELSSDSAQCEYSDIMVRARIIGLPDEIDPSQIRYSWHSGTLPYGPAGITADSMLYTNISTTQYVWVEAYIEPEPGQCIFNGKNAPVRSRNLFLPVIPQRILGVNIDVYPGTKVCQFEEVRFNATQVVSGLKDAGENPITDWYHNGKWVYQGKTYVPDTTLHDGDSIYAIITASPELVCLDTNRKATKTLHMEVIPAPVLKAHNDTLLPYGVSVPLWAEVIAHYAPTLKYEWYPNFDIETPGFTPYDSATQAVPRIDHYYVVEALNSAGCLSNKAQVHVEVLTCPQFIIRGNTNTVCMGDTALIYVMVQGFRPYTNEYIWQMSNDGGTSWNNIKIDTTNYFQIVGERSITLGIPKTQLMHDASRAVFRCLAIATDERLDCDTIPSMNLYLDLVDFKVPTPRIDIPKPLCQSHEVLLTASGAANPDDYYQWYLNGEMVEGNNNVFTFDSLKNGDTLVVRVRNDVNACVNRLHASDTQAVFVHSSPKLIMTPDTAIFMGGTAMVGTKVIEGTAVEPFTYRWRAGGRFPVTLADTTADTTYTRNQTRTTHYTVTVTDSVGCDTKGTVQVRIADTCDLIPEIYGPQHLCLGDDVTFIGLVTGGLDSKDLVYSWSITPSIDSTWILAGGDTLTFNVNQYHSGAYTLSFTVEDLSELSKEVCGADTRKKTVTTKVYVSPERNFDVKVNGSAEVCRN
ncbi:MAG: hypothetical protein K2M92_01775, partial [Bacteroidales bacterium]|nr:hypothetical protein [Bacteroidales bacterium]